MRAPKIKKIPKYYEGGSVKKMAEGGKVDSSVPMMDFERDERPTINFDSTEIPEISDWKVGQVYPIIIYAKQTSVHTIEHGNKKGKMEATFKIEKAGYCPEEDEEAEFEGYARGGTVSAEKARTMLKDNSAQGHPLTPKQKRYFGWIAGGSKPSKKSNGGYAQGGTVQQDPKENKQLVSEYKGGKSVNEPAGKPKGSMNEKEAQENGKEGYYKTALQKKKKSIRSSNALDGVSIERMK